MSPSRDRTLRVDTLARVEGEGSLYAKIRRGKLKELRFRIYEPPRFFEAFLRGKGFAEVPDITARICGICPVAYQMSSVHALEGLFGTLVPAGTRELRRLLYCAEYIESHALHIYLLQAPDLLGYPDAVAMAKDHKALVETGLRLKKAGNTLMAVIGGREIHPVSVKVGGFHKAVCARRLKELTPELAWAREAAEETLRWACAQKAPAFEVDYEFVALRHPGEYPLNEGRIVSSKGLDIAACEFNGYFSEVQVPHSNALHCLRKGGGPYLVGPLARFNLNFDRLPQSVRRVCESLGLVPTVRNPFLGMAVRAAELLFACEEALRLIAAYRAPDPSSVEPRPRPGEGHAATEAPRGILYHRYRTDASGRILEAQIVPPTAQNQARIEADLWEYLPRVLDLPKEEFSLACETAVRNYDPCISCATHFLDVELDKDG